MCGNGKRWICKVAVRLAEPVQIDLKASDLGLKKVGPRQMRGPFLHLIKLLKDSLYRFYPSFELFHYLFARILYNLAEPFMAGL